MDILQECAVSFEKLFHKNYVITAGRKGKLVTITIIFQAEHFHHLIGLHKLIDLPQISKAKNKTIIFHNVKSAKITYDEIKSSIYIEEVDQRMKYFTNIENLLNSKIIIKFDKRKAYTSINAKFLIYELYEGIYIHLFFEPKNQELHIPCAFFPREDAKFVNQQEIFTVLKIEKVDWIQK